MLRRCLFAAVACAIALVGFQTVDADVYVRGHYRSNGTYVSPHYRSNPDGNPYNNWSTYPNVNPYTGRMGTRRVPSYSPTFRSYSPSYQTPSYYRSYKPTYYFDDDGSW
jgi:hypothetical protein